MILRLAFAAQCLLYPFPSLRNADLHILSVLLRMLHLRLVVGGDAAGAAETPAVPGVHDVAATSVDIAGAAVSVRSVVSASVPASC
jgi:hypothetical protein